MKDTMELCSTLAECEAIIERNLQSFVEAGRALQRIREKRLYRTDYPTFEAYCQKKWGFARQRAYQFISAATVSANLSTIVDKPKTESQVRELAKIKEGDTQIAVWKEVVATAPRGKVTAAHVKKVVFKETNQARKQYPCVSVN